MIKHKMTCRRLYGFSSCGLGGLGWRLNKQGAGQGGEIGKRRKTWEVRAVWCFLCRKGDPE